MLQEKLTISDYFKEMIESDDMKETYKEISKENNVSIPIAMAYLHPYINFDTMEPNINNGAIYCFGNFPIHAFKETENKKQMDVEYPVLNNYKRPYCVADNLEQVKKYYDDEIKDPNASYIISLFKVYQDKSNAGKFDGWRWEKWGEYIGELEPKHEYLDDEVFDPEWQGYVICANLNKIS